ncbi:MAG TPA: methyl-accepting chemotaxis protein [Rubrivivax sp.]|nr:methyl-accepting chemotaxis protein [Rubrivivax sp.]
MSAVLPPAADSLPAAPGAPAARGFFAHHGIWAPGVRLFRRLGFTAKALTISLAFTVPMAVLLAWLVLAQGERMLESRRDSLRQQVALAQGLAGWAQAQTTPEGGSLTTEQAQALALRALAALRTGDDGAFWVTGAGQRFLLHPQQPQLQGRSAGELRDADGLPFHRAAAEAVRLQGHGFVEFRQAGPGSGAPLRRIAYAQDFAPWGWVIGADAPVGDLRRTMLEQGAWVLGTVLLSLLVAGYLFLSFHRVMDGGLRETRRHLRAMTAGDLTTHPRGWGRDETAQLINELGSMQGSLRGMVGSVRRSSAEIVAASDALSRDAGDLAQRTEHAAAQLEGSAAAMRRISEAAQRGAEHTEEASRKARHNAELADDGGRVMNEVVDTMAAIQAASARIGEIVGTIDGIAFQTNILALNAAVEAARAGPQGKGFGVVAAEVRTLAQRSAAAAKEIKALIQGSVQQVETGTLVVRKAGSAMADVVGASRRVDELLGAMATGAREQSTGIGQIGQAVHELDRMTQQNAALVERTVAAAAAMRALAQHLAAEVARYRTPDVQPAGAGTLRPG